MLPNMKRIRVQLTIAMAVCSLAKAYETLRFKANKTPASSRKINAFAFVQRGLSNLKHFCFNLRHILRP